MSNKIINVEKSEVEKLQNLSAEVEARRSVLAAMIQEGIDTELASFKKYQADYTKFYLAYETAKKELENTYVKPTETGAKKWDLDFATGNLTVEF